MGVSVGYVGQDGWKVIVVGSVLMFMQLLMLCGRLVSRSLKKSRLQKDDMMLIIGVTLTFALCALAFAFPRVSGVAEYVGQNNTGDLTISPGARKAFVAWTVLYGLSVAASKFAILLLYLRVFTTGNRWFSITLFAMGFLIIGTAVANTLVAIFSCQPVSHAWRDPQTSNGSCIDVVAFNRLICIPNIISGIVMLFMPLPPVFKLNIATLQKVGLSATFLHGVIGVLASIARLCALSSSNIQPISSTIWTLNEPANYLIAACLPTLRPIFLRLLPDSFFVFSRKRPASSKPYTSVLKISWSRGSLIPIKFGVERDHFAASPSNSGRGGSEGQQGGGSRSGGSSPRRGSLWNVFGGGGGRNGSAGSGAETPEKKREGVVLDEKVEKAFEKQKNGGVMEDRGIKVTEANLGVSEGSETPVMRPTTADLFDLVRK